MVYECIAAQFVWIGIKKYFYFTLKHIKNDNNNNDDNNNNNDNNNSMEEQPAPKRGSWLKGPKGPVQCASRAGWKNTLRKQVCRFGRRLPP